MEIEKRRTEEIVRLHTEIFGSLKVCLDKAIRIGELLTEQKEFLGHGNFTPWVKVNLPFTDRTARNYMKVYRERDRLKTETISDLTPAYKLLTAEPLTIEPKNGESELQRADRLNRLWDEKMKWVHCELVQCEALFKYYEEDSNLTTTERMKGFKGIIDRITIAGNICAEIHIRQEAEAGRLLSELQKEGFTLDDINEVLKAKDEDRDGILWRQVFRILFQKAKQERPKFLELLNSAKKQHNLTEKRVQDLVFPLWKTEIDKYMQGST